MRKEIGFDPMGIGKYLEGYMSREDGEEILGMIKTILDKNEVKSHYSKNRLFISAEEFVIDKLWNRVKETQVINQEILREFMKIDR